MGGEEPPGESKNISSRAREEKALKSQLVLSSSLSLALLPGWLTLARPCNRAVPAQLHASHTSDQVCVSWLKFLRGKS